jgi:sugar-specific transcriptional regulator TrmB
LSQERVLKTLVGLGLTQHDSQVYLFLSKKGLQRGRDLISGLKITKQQLYRSLKTLQSRGIVNATLERPARFSAVPLEKVLDSFLKAKIEETQRLQQDKDSILSDWQSISIEENNNTPPKFAVIEGRSSIYPKIQQMVQATRKGISVVASVPGLIQGNQFGLFDFAFSHPLKSKIQFRFLTEVHSENANAMRTLLKQVTNAKINFEGRKLDSALKLFPRMVIRDEEEILFFITPTMNMSMVEHEDVCLWTNCKPLLQAFMSVFEQLWRNAIDTQKKTQKQKTEDTNQKYPAKKTQQ